MRPVKLHRRDPRIKYAGQDYESEDEPTLDRNGKPIDDKERERIEIARAERRAEREANMAQVAPIARTATKKKNHFQRKTEQIFQVSEMASKKKAQEIRYEEAIPWHVEDFENKNIWRGTYESAMSESHVAFLPENRSGGQVFRMVPVEKWYRFTPKDKFKTISIDEAEARRAAKFKDPRWYMEAQQRHKKEVNDDLFSSRMFTRAGGKNERLVKNEDDAEQEEVAPDADELDYDDEQDFADDEENEKQFVDDPEENKEVANKLKREQREANVFDIKEERDYDKEELGRISKKEEERKIAKRTQRALMKREGNYDYDMKFDSDGNEIFDSDYSDDSETERLKEEERKKAEDQLNADKAKADPGITISPSKQAISLSSKSSKPDSLLRKLKRPGSPNLSEASGNESSARKKPKKMHGISGISTPIPNGASISRPGSPLHSNRVASPAPSSVSATGSSQIPRTSSTLKVSMAAGSASDGEASDSTRKGKKIRLSRPGSPSGSQPGSPLAAGSPSSSQPISQRKQIVEDHVQDHPLMSIVPTTIPTPEQVRAAIPPEGIPLKGLIAVFGKPVAKQPAFTKLLRENSLWKGDRVFPKTGTPLTTPAAAVSSAPAQAAQE